MKTAVGWHGKVLGRATPTVVNTAYNTQFMWDGRKKSLEDQALGPMNAAKLQGPGEAALGKTRDNGQHSLQRPDRPLPAKENRYA